MRMKLSYYMSSLLGLIFPETCVGCGEPLTKSERVLCTECIYKLPQTKYHLMKHNPVEEIFWGRVEIEHATAFCYFVKGGRLQKMLHALKYHQRQDVGELLGELLGSALQGAEQYADVDAIVAVPLHPKKERLRGFNQSDCIALGLSRTMELPFVKPLTRRVFNPTQTKKGRYERWENVKGIFEASQDFSFREKHFLLVDDVMTTGSTLEAAAYALKKIQGAKVSLAVVGLA